ncbi:hypothetical protein NLG97_g9899 [Lecanicillium saksenae]|uniref:Uncharacterized protein n=1 Tax=Lecanicillium saksenae TaxID=468837 RepID=A0ACC1QF76_9HYPO|nr:hypothetical protein NLG97_g9899 [Lecanicillium saksenae]
MTADVEDKAHRKACSPCAKAKVRCTWTRSDVSTSSRKAPICDRCLRLKKVCGAQPPSARAAPVPRTRFGQLEKKVESLLCTLQNQERPQSQGQEAITPASTIKSTPSPITTFKNRPNDHSSDFLAPTQSLLSAEAQVADEALWPPNDQADTLLAIYTTGLGQVFPFVVPPNIPASELRSTRPFLFKAMITAASYHNRDVQKRRARDFTISMTNCMLLEGYKSFDLLQGLLLQVAWYHCHVKRNSQMTNLMQLAVAVMADLGLNKPVHANDRRKLVYDVTRSTYGFTSDTQVLSNDERRALLGCYYLSSTASTIYRKIDPLAFSRHMENALEQLLASQERESDVLLYHLVRLQNIVQDITTAIPYDEPCATQSRGMPFVMHVKMLAQSLSKFQVSLPAALQDNDILLMNIHTANIFLYEVSLYDAPWEGTILQQRLDGLWSCVEALHAFFRTFCAMPAASYIILPYSIWGQLSHALLLLSRVCIVEIDGWDKSLIGDDKKFLFTLDNVMARLYASHSFAKTNWLGQTEDAILQRVISKFGWMRKWFVEHTGEKTDSTAVAAGPMENGFLADCGQEFQENIFMDSRFWEEIMAEYHILPEAFMLNSIPGQVLH